MKEFNRYATLAIDLKHEQQQQLSATRPGPDIEIDPRSTSIESMLAVFSAKKESVGYADPYQSAE